MSDRRRQSIPILGLAVTAVLLLLEYVAMKLMPRLGGGELDFSDAALPISAAIAAFAWSALADLDKRIANLEEQSKSSRPK